MFNLPTASSTELSKGFLKSQVRFDQNSRKMVSFGSVKAIQVKLFIVLKGNVDNNHHAEFYISLISVALWSLI